MIKLSDYIAKRLKEHGIEHFFMVSGGGAMHLNDSLGRNIQYTANHHEQGCAIAAEGYARVNQKLVAVNVTTGPGGINAMNGLFGQWTDSVPVLYISGQVKFSTCKASCPELNLRQLGDQEVDIISLVKPLTKFATMITDAKMIKYYIDKAVWEATHGRMGPVWLDVPMNIQGAQVDENELVEFIPPADSTVDCSKQCDEIIKKLAGAKRPLVVAGHGIRLSNQIDNFYKFIEKANIPVVTTFNGYDLLETEHRLFSGRIGTVGQRAGNFVLQNADCVLFLGTRNNIRQISYNWENFAKNAYKIIVDIDDAELKKPLVKPDMPVCADLKYIMPNLAENVQELAIDDWRAYCSKMKERYNFEHTKEYHTVGNIINVYDFVHTLTKAMKETDILVATNGSACVCLHQTGIVKKGQRQFWNAGDASMGYGLPAALGACYEAKGRNVICLEGDGSIMMNIQELQTIAFNQLPLKIFIINNAGYSSIRQTQRNFFNGHMTGSGDDSGVSVPDFTKVAEAFGLKAVRLNNPETLYTDIQNVLATKGPIVCEVMVEKEYAFLPKLSARKLDDGTMISPSLEDMFPFIDRKEYKENMI